MIKYYFYFILVTNSEYVILVNKLTFKPTLTSVFLALLVLNLSSRSAHT